MVQQSKKELRREMKLVLSNLDTRWTSKAHSEVCGQLASLVDTLTDNAAHARNIFAWIPCFLGEIDLAEFIGEMLKTSSVYLPRLDDEGGMEYVKIADDWGAHLSAGPRGILQTNPGYGERFIGALQGQTFVVIPGLAFDQRGGRLGRGAGHYDRFLCRPEISRATKIGVCWSMQVVQDIPMDQHDVRMDWICHERGVLKAAGGLND
jgi:5-formyltetrahydrofolate cyclo-ligase